MIQTAIQQKSKILRQYINYKLLTLVPSNKKLKIKEDIYLLTKLKLHKKKRI